MAFNIILATPEGITESQQRGLTVSMQCNIPAAVYLTELSCLQVSEDQCVRRVCNDVSVVALNSHLIDFVAVKRLQHDFHARRQVLHNHLQHMARTEALADLHKLWCGVISSSSSSGSGND